MANKYTGEGCPGCKKKPGEQHTVGCDWEECPFCHSQIIACNCDIPTEVGMTLAEAREFENEGKMSDEHAAIWEDKLAAKGYILVGEETRFG